MSNEKTPKVFGKKLSVKQLAVIALFAAVECILAPFAIPLGTTLVPISIATFVIYLFAYLLPPLECTLGVAVYLLLGAVGLPVFSGAAGGLGKMLGPTGGYLIGYLFLAFICSLIDWKFPKKYWLHIIGMIAATAVLYLFGTVWYMISTETAFVPALSGCVIPFLPGDGVKIALAVILGTLLRSALVKAKLIEI